MDAPRFLLLAKRLTATNEQLLEALRLQGLDAEWIAEPEAVRPLDTVLARLDVLPTLDGVEDGLWQLRRLERAGIRVLNTFSTLLTTHDKLATASALARAGVPHPRTVVAVDPTAPPPLEPPVVLKPRFGSWGRDVLLCEASAALRRRLRELATKPWFERHGALVQELVTPLGRDLRLVVARGRIVGAVERVAAPGEWRTNVALGARRRRVAAPPPDAVELALAAADAVDGDFVGVDLLPTETGGWVVVELNGAVDFTLEYSLRGTSVFDAAAAALAAPVEADAAVAAL